MPKVPLFGNIGTLPDTSGDVVPQSLAILATNDQWPHGIFRFNDSGNRDGINFARKIPDDYGSGAGILLEWSTSATTGDAEFDVDYRAVGGDNAESIDQSGVQESVNSNDTAPSTTFFKMQVTISVTDGNLAAGDILQGTVFRDGTDAGDTISAAIILIGAWLDYTAA